ncbi:MAG: hypothetical protein HGA45_41915, partial [Chloroflexales bacterium]|nr:hypothetical protein [Chloroflexales bacterium]
MRRLIPLLLAALLSGCAMPIPGVQAPTQTPAPTMDMPEPTAHPLGSPVTVQEGGFIVSPPDGWASEIVSGTATLAPSRAALDRASPGPDLVLAIDATPLPALAAQFGAAAAQSPETFFEISSGAAQEAGYTISATSPITVDGRPGLAADLSAPGGAGRLAVILTADSAVRVLGQSAPEAWADQAPIYDDVLASLRFFALPAPTPAPVDDAEQPVVIEDGPP